MPRYIVGVREVHVSYRLVEADSADQALDEAGRCGVEIDLEYSHTLDKGYWTVEMLPEDADISGVDLTEDNWTDENPIAGSHKGRQQAQRQ